MVIPLIKWFHLILAHPSCKQSCMTIQARYYHPDIRKHIDFFHCNYCQHVKIPCKGMGLLPEWDLTNTPWYEVSVDLIGLWSAKTGNFNGKFYALTCIDTTTKLLELVHINTKSIDAIARKFKNKLLTQYPRPAQVVHDNRGKFTGNAFAHLLFIL